MDSTKKLRKHMLKLPGFFFGTGNVFSSKGVAEQIYRALLSPEARVARAGVDQEALDQAKKHVAAAITDLFQICLRHNGLYVALRGSSVFWDAVISEWHTDGEITVAQVRELVDVFIRARGVYQGPQQTELTRNVELWGNVMQHVASLGPATTIELALRPTQLGQVTTALQGMQVAPPTEASWPPAHFGPQEIAWITDSRMRASLMSVRLPFNPSTANDFPKPPHQRSDPIEVKQFLAFVALAKWAPGADWAIFMPPMAFLQHRDRQPWYAVLGSMMRTHSSLESFISYTKTSFNQGRRTVAGVYLNWPRTVPQHLAHHEASNTGESLPEFWKQHSMREAVAVVLTRLSSQDNTTQLVIVDHAPNPQNIQANRWKAKLVDMLEKKFNITELWYGNSCSNDLVRFSVNFSDSVGVSCGFLWDVANGTFDVSDPARSNFTKRY
ncbi:hypothetical protein F4780DRAFT_783745 [Xylariomycetidae sp. FL0641]|nr:hypothetical protein F4780DRAFT_783745 [Xylariomycetidae sp. FL0641]